MPIEEATGTEDYSRAATRAHQKKMAGYISSLSPYLVSQLPALHFSRLAFRSFTTFVLW